MPNKTSLTNESPVSQALFTYGTLMHGEIFRMVTSTTPTALPAVLDDYTRRALRGRIYPALQPCPGIKVAGILYTGIDATTFRKLDLYEGDMYTRTTVSVSCEEQITSAFTYMLKPEWHHVTEEHDWDYDLFLARHAKSYCASLARVNTSERC